MARLKGLCVRGAVAGLMVSSLALGHGWAVGPNGPTSTGFPPTSPVGCNRGIAPSETARPERPARDGAPAGGATPGGAASGGVVGGVVRGGVAVRRRPASAEDRVRPASIAWTPAFLPETGPDGYAKSALAVGEALRRPAHDGGLAREGKPTIVFLYDAGDKAHVAALRALNEDGRLRTASTFFNLFRIDAAVDAKAAPKGPTFAVYSAAGELVGETAADKRLGRAYELMEAAYARSGGELGVDAAKVDAAQKARADAEARLRAAESTVVCPHCGELREDALAEIAALKARLVAAVVATARRA